MFYLSHPTRGEWIETFSSESESVFDIKSISLFCDVQDFMKQIVNCINNDIDAWKSFSCFESSEYADWLKNTTNKINQIMEE